MEDSEYKTNKKQKVTPDGDVLHYLDQWQKGKAFVDTAIRDFKRLDTIANAQYENGNSKNPNIGDTTIAGIVRQVMRTAVKTIPHVTISINGSQSTLEAIIVKNRVEKVLLNPTTFGKGFVSIMHLAGRGSMSRGFNVFQVSAQKLYGKFGVLPKMVHFNDFVIEPGVQDGSHSTYFYIRTKMTPGKINGILKREKAKPKGQSTWNIPALQALIAQGADSSGASDYAEYLTPMEQSKVDASADTFDIITRYSNDPTIAICTFSPSINQKLREVPNRSKFGYPRVLFLVIDPAELSPFGDSRVRLASPNQNFLMALRQNVGSTWLYNSKPTMVKSGLFTGATNLKSGGVITSTDPTAKVTLLTLDTTTSDQFPTISQEITAQIQTMMGMNPGQALGAIGDSKTGVGAQAQKQGLDDAIQQITTIMEEFLCQYIISGVDLYLSEQDGKGIIYVDDITRAQVLKINPKLFPFPENPNAMEVDWAALYKKIEEIDVEVDTTMSESDWTDSERGDLQDALTVISQTTDPDDPAAVAKKNAIEDKFLEETAPELASVLTTDSPLPGATPPSAAPGAGQPAAKSPAESITFGDAVKAGALDTAAAIATQAGLPSNDLINASPTATTVQPQPDLTQPQQ